MARIFVILGFVLVVAGMIVAWPLIYATSHHQMVRGRMLEVFSETLPDQRVRLSVAYDFPIPGPHGKLIAIGHAQADQRFRPVPDVVIPAAHLHAYERILLREAPVRRVFFDVDDPVGTAFMVTDIGIDRHLTAEQGVAVGLLGLLMWCVGYLVRVRSPL